MKRAHFLSVILSVLFGCVPVLCAGELEVLTDEEYLNIPEYSGPSVPEAPLDRTGTDQSSGWWPGVKGSPPLMESGSSESYGQNEEPKLKPYRPDTAETLFDFLPPVGRQGNMDCVAWAFGYASITCLIAQERRRSPKSDYDKFSPGYIYEHVEKQHDQTLRLGPTLQFLTEKGSASIASFKAKEQGDRGRARKEAELYKSKISRPKNLNDIKSSIKNGSPVVLFIRQNSEFHRGAARESDSEFFIYGEGSHYVAGIYSLSPNHAVTAVGYDDERQALLIMNSYGTQWFDSGFCWVSYSLFKRKRWLPKSPANAIGYSCWCHQAFIVKARESTRSVSVGKEKSQGAVNRVRRYFGKTKNKYRLENKGVYKKQDRISLPDWNISGVAANEKSLFAYVESITNANSPHFGRSREVIRLNTDNSWTFLSDRWQDSKITRSPPGDRPRFSMMASTPTTNLHVLTDSSQVYEFEPIASELVKIEIPMSTNELPVDLRARQLADAQTKNICVTSSLGNVYVRKSNKWVKK